MAGRLLCEVVTMGVRLGEMVCVTPGNCEKQATGNCMRRCGSKCVPGCAEESCEVVLVWLCITQGGFEMV